MRKEKGVTWGHRKSTGFESLSLFIHLSLAKALNFSFFNCKNGNNSIPVLSVLQAYCEIWKKEAGMTVSADSHYCC